MTKPTSQINDETMRALALFAAGILLNIGLFFVLALFAPLVVGIACGYILGHKRNGILTGFLSAVVSYSLMFIVAAFGTNFLDLVGAVLIMSIIGGAGGFIGAYLQKKMIESSS